jgi:prepilin-type N-terminal cleavage/methylation domain-containing protein
VGPEDRGVRPGFTLVEVVLSLAVSSLIMLGVVSTMLVAQHGLAASAAMSDSASQTDRAIQMITLDVSLATAITERTDKAITLVVPDRTGDGQPETIRYAWSGTAGDPLTRQYNGGAPAILADKVYQFHMTYLLQTLQPPVYPLGALPSQLPPLCLAPAGVEATSWQ